MNAPSDAQLLQAYAEGHSESAFAELVRRHLDLVHSAALRMVCDSHLAEDVTQRVFVALAKNAAQLTDRPVLSGWLHRTAQNIAAQTVRTDVRRRAREQEAAAMNELLATGPEATWEAVAPHLDVALGELNETDRDAVLLRYFEKKSAQEMADIFGISDDAAQKRVSRAVERLREFFSKQNVKIGAGGLAVLISANAVQSAPIGLAAAISAAVVLTGTAISTSTAITATKAIAMTTLQKTIIGAALVAALGTGAYEAREAASARAEAQTVQQQQALLAEQVSRLQRERDEATNQSAALLAENEQLKSSANEIELLKLRAEVTQLKNAEAQKANDPMEVAAKAWLTRVNLLKQRLEQTPNEKIPELQFAKEKDWLYAALGSSQLKTDDDYRWDLHNLYGEVEDTFGSMAMNALQKFIQANNGQFPTALSQLQPYFDSPVDDAILQRYEIVPANTIPKAKEMSDSWLIAQKIRIDENDKNDQREVIGPKGYGSSWTFW